MARRMLGPLIAWPVRTQQGARRNALVASTALAERRRQRDDVDEFFARRTGTGRASQAAAQPRRPRREVI